MPQQIVCQTCGDRGFPEALNYCIRCMETAEHTYCLEKLPEVLNEDIYWTCEICLSKTVVGDSSFENSVLTIDISQCDGTCEEEAPCLGKQKNQTTTCSAQTNAVKTTPSTTSPSQTMPKRVRKIPTTNTESTTYSTQTRLKRVRKIATTNTESTTYSTQTRSMRVRKTAATNTQPRVASQNRTPPVLRKRTGRK